MSCTLVFKGHKRYSEGREEVDEYSGRPSRSKTNVILGKVNEIIRNDRRLGTQMINNMVTIDKEKIRKQLKTLNQGQKYS